MLQYLMTRYFQWKLKNRIMEVYFQFQRTSAHIVSRHRRSWGGGATSQGLSTLGRLLGNEMKTWEEQENEKVTHDIRVRVWVQQFIFPGQIPALNMIGLPYCFSVSVEQNVFFDPAATPENRTGLGPSPPPIATFYRKNCLNHFPVRLAKTGVGLWHFIGSLFLSRQHSV